MATITAPPKSATYSAGTDLVLKGDPVSITGTTSGLWGSYTRGVDGGDLILSAGDGKSVANNGSAQSTINGGSVVIQGGRAVGDLANAGGLIRTFAGAIKFQSGALQQTNNQDATSYVTEMILQNNRLGVGTSDVATRSETLQVAGSIYSSGGVACASLKVGAAGTTINGIVMQKVAIPANFTTSDTTPVVLAVANPFNTTNVVAIASIQALFSNVFNDGGMFSSVGVITSTNVDVHVCRPKNYNGTGNAANAWGTNQAVLHVQISTA
jgi:hypothetical protein